MAYRVFVEAAAPIANISYVIGTNLKQGDAGLGAAHIAGIGEAGLWPFVSGIEIGNEVDHWNPGQLNFAVYEARFAKFTAAYLAVSASATLTDVALIGTRHIGSS